MGRRTLEALVSSKRSSLLRCLVPAERVTVLFSAIFGSGAFSYGFAQNGKRDSSVDPDLESMTVGRFARKTLLPSLDRSPDSEKKRPRLDARMAI
jgi:hypothetical protein